MFLARGNAVLTNQQPGLRLSILLLTLKVKYVVSAILVSSRQLAELQKKKKKKEHICVVI